MTLSSWSTTSLEDVMAEDPNGLRWFQLYVYRDRDITLQLIQRAEKAGYKALAITVDTPVLGRREADVKNKFSLPPHLTMANFAELGGSHAAGAQSSGSKGSGLASYVAALVDQTLSWSDIAWVRRHTKMKIVVKGVMTVEDARASLKFGVDGIWVSNHGARQLDTTPATIEVLPEIVKAVRGRVEVYVDGGIMRGTDVLKVGKQHYHVVTAYWRLKTRSIFQAVALGARAVFIGRPVLWGLAHSGEEGVCNVLKLMNDELVMAMKLTGALSVGVRVYHCLALSSIIFDASN